MTPEQPDPLSSALPFVRQGHSLLILRSTIILALLVIVGISVNAAMNSSMFPWYDTAFKDDLIIRFPLDDAGTGFDKNMTALDGYLRSNKIGYLSDLSQSHARMISATVRTDFSKINAKSEVTKWVPTFGIPPDAQVSSKVFNYSVNSGDLAAALEQPWETLTARYRVTCGCTSRSRIEEVTISRNAESYHADFRHIQGHAQVVYEILTTNNEQQTPATEGQASRSFNEAELTQFKADLLAYFKAALNADTASEKLRKPGVNFNAWYQAERLAGRKVILWDDPRSIEIVIEKAGEEKVFRDLFGDASNDSYQNLLIRQVSK